MDKDNKGVISRLKLYSLIIGLIGSVLGAMVMWVSLDLPRMAMLSEVRATESAVFGKIDRIGQTLDQLSTFEIQTRQLLLNQEWWRLEREITDLSGQEQNEVSRNYIIQLRQQQDAVKAQLDALKKLAANPPSSGV